MAGGKETPRQKMIGMMYLFLTAMLAINVSDSLLHRFLFINETLEGARDVTSERNEGFLEGIKTAVADRKNQAEDLAVLDQATQVRKISKSMMEKLDEIKELLIEETGGYDSENNLVGFKNSEALAHHMINQGEGDDLKNDLNNFAVQLGGIAGVDFAPIAYDGKDHPLFKSDPNQSKKEFSALFFENTPLAAGLATITQFENEVLRYETEALEFLAEKVGAKAVDFDRIFAMVRPVSQRVAAGTKYEADLFISATSSALTPTMFVNGNEIPVDTATGMGRVSFMATPPPSGEAYNQENVFPKTFNAEIRLNIPGQGDTTFTNSVEYFVIKPTINVQSEAVNALYFRCGNEMRVEVPALGTAYNPTFRAEGATVVPGSKTGSVTLIPNSRKVKLLVYNDNNFIGNQEFDVRGVPLPEVRVEMGGRPADTQRGVKVNQIRSLSAVVIPDEDFARLLPNDAKYRVAEWTVSLASGPRRKGEPLRFTTSEGNISRFRQLARPGDRLVIEVKRVERLNYQGNKEEVRVTFQPLNIPVN